MKAFGLIAFFATGLLVAWLTRNAGMSAGICFVVAFVPAIIVGALVDKLLAKKR